jgi:hypothetical protein
MVSPCESTLVCAVNIITTLLSETRQRVQTVGNLQEMMELLDNTTKIRNRLCADANETCTRMYTTANNLMVNESVLRKLIDGVRDEIPCGGAGEFLACTQFQKYNAELQAQVTRAINIVDKKDSAARLLYDEWKLTAKKCTHECGIYINLLVTPELCIPTKLLDPQDMLNAWSIFAKVKLADTFNLEICKDTLDWLETKL